MTLLISQYVDLPPHQQGGFDHADVHLKSGRVYVAHTAAGTLEIMDGESAKHLVTVPGCLGASGVICAQNENLVFAAALKKERIPSRSMRRDRDSMRFFLRVVVQLSTKKHSYSVNNQ